MKLLVVEPRNLFPPDTGAKILSGNVIARLCELHDVTVVVNVDPCEPAEHLDRLRGFRCGVVAVPWKDTRNFTLRFYLEVLRCFVTGDLYAVAKFCTPELKARAAQLACEQQVEAVLCDTISAFMPHVDFRGAPWIAVAHNMEHRLRDFQAAQAASGLRAGYLRYYARKIREFEISAFGRADHVVTVSEPDAEYVRSVLKINTVSALPPGVDTRYFAPAGPEGQEPGLVFTGSMDWPANYHGAEFFVREVLPKVKMAVPGARFTIVGRKPPAHVRALAQADPGHVVVTGPVDDVRPYLARAQVVVVPVLFGSGIKIKVFEAMAMAKPVVVTTVGAEGLPLTHGENALIADTAEDMAARCIELLRDPGKRRRLGERARATVLNGHDWSVVAAELARICEEVAARRRKPH